MRYIILLIFLGHFLTIHSQDGFAVDKNRISVLNDINWTTNNAKVFNSILEKKNILVLSESDHGHGSSVDAQCMIMKGLIDSAIIDAIYIEASWINCDYIMRELTTGGQTAKHEAEKYMQSYQLKYWVKIGFWDYLADKIIAGKIKLYGFDIEGISPAIMRQLYSEAISFDTVRKFLSVVPGRSNIFSATFNTFEGLSSSTFLPRDAFIEIDQFNSIVIQAYKSKGSTYREKQWKSIADLFYWLYKRGIVLKNNKYNNVIDNDKQLVAFLAIRDSMMANMFLRQYRLNSGDKVVCAMAAYHALKNVSSIESIFDCCTYPYIKTMGELINDKLGDQIYNICFIAASGEYGADWAYDNKYLKVKKPKKGSLEDWLNKSGQSYCFLNLEDGVNKNYSFYMNVVFDKFFKAKWVNNFQGVLFIRTMKPLAIR